MKFLKILLLLIFFVSLIPLVIVIQTQIGVSMTVLNPDFFLSEFNRNRLYENITELWKEEIENSTGSAMSSETAESFNNAVSSAFREFAEKSVRNIVGNAGTFIFGNSESIEFNIDFTDFKINIQENLIDNLPRVERRIMNYILEEMPDTINLTEEMGDEKYAFEEEFNKYRFILILPAVSAAVMLLLSFIMLGFRGGLKYTGFAFLVPGILVGAAVIAGTITGLPHLKEFLAGEILPFEEPVLTEPVFYLIESFASVVRNIGFVAAGTGILFIIISAVIKSAGKKKTEAPAVRKNEAPSKPAEKDKTAVLNAPPAEKVKTEKETQVKSPQPALKKEKSSFNIIPFLSIAGGIISAVIIYFTSGGSNIFLTVSVVIIPVFLKIFSKPLGKLLSGLKWKSKMPPLLRIAAGLLIPFLLYFLFYFTGPGSGNINMNIAVTAGSISAFLLIKKPKTDNRKETL